MSDVPPTNAAPPPPASARKRWWPWGLILVVAALSIFIFRHPLLRSIASILIVDESGPLADVLLIMGGDRSEEKAAELYHSRMIGRVVIFDFAPGRLQRLKILPTHADTVIKELLKHQVPRSAIEVVPAQATSSWDRARALDDWLAARPKETRVLICCERLESRRLASILDQALSAAHRSKVKIYPLTHRYFDETNWWQRKEGVISVFHGTIYLGYVTLIGEDTTEWREWDPDEYEARLKNAG